MTEFQVLAWKGIPAQVRVSSSGKRFSRQLPERYQKEIDRVAMEEGMWGTDAYLGEWKWSNREERAGNADQVLDSIVEELINKWDLELFGRPQN